MTTPVRIGVCLKWVAPDDDHRFAGVSPADAAALEWSLRVAEAWGGEVVAATVGPVPAEAALRDAVAIGAQQAVRVDAPAGLDSPAVAGALARVLDGCSLVWCGDYSSDRGSGSVPAFLAAELAMAQALGLVGVEVSDAAIDVLRRLDGGRREVLRVGREDRVVLSVEGSTARARRASLRASLAARSTVPTVVTGSVVGEIATPVLRPFRPRARVLSAPAGESSLDRLRALTDAGTGAQSRGETVELDPLAAAERILSALAGWGERPV